MVARLLVFLLVLLYGGMAHANVVSTSHDPMSWAGHDNARVLAAQSGDHGHSHADDAADAHGTGHEHGQHTADHSHDKTNLPQRDFNVVMEFPALWDRAAQNRPYAEPYFSFERPPKQLPL